MSHLCVTLGESLFPSRLGSIPSPPERLWVLGHAERLPEWSTRSIAVVGSRAAYDKAIALEPNNQLIKQNYDLFKELNDRAAQKDGRQP